MSAATREVDDVVTIDVKSLPRRHRVRITVEMPGNFQFGADFAEWVFKEWVAKHPVTEATR
jgi:hypothetical protein